MNFSLLDQFVESIKFKVNVNYEWLEKYKRFLEEKELPGAVKFKSASHHVLPKSEAKAIGIPSRVYNSDWNYVELYHKDHSLAHYYLALAVPAKRLCWAAKTMLGRGINARLFSLSEFEAMTLADDYAYVREASAEFISEFLKGRDVSAETRAKIGRGRLGKKDSEESRRKKSIARMGMVVPEETRAKHRRENMTDEQRKRLSDSHGPMPEEEKEIRRQRMREMMKDKPKSESQKIKLALANEGKRWYNNGIVEIKVDATDNTILDGFIRGTLPCNKERKIGLRNPNAGNIKWTNGKVEVRSKVCPGDNFVKGSLASYNPPQDLFNYACL
jgi:hypothetical protein